MRSPWRRTVRRRRRSGSGGRLVPYVPRSVHARARRSPVVAAPGYYAGRITPRLLNARASAMSDYKSWNQRAQHHERTGKDIGTQTTKRNYKNRSFFSGYSLKPFRKNFSQGVSSFARKGYISKISQGNFLSNGANYTLLIGHNCLPIQETFRAIWGSVIRHVFIKWGFDLKSWDQDISHPVHPLLAGNIELNIFYKTSVNGSVQHDVATTNPQGNSYMTFLDAVCDKFLALNPNTTTYFEVNRIVFQCTASVTGGVDQQFNAQCYYAEECEVLVHGNSNLQIQNRTGTIQGQGADQPAKDRAEATADVDVIGNNPIRGKMYLAYGSLQEPTGAETTVSPPALTYNAQTGILYKYSGQYTTRPYSEEMKKPFPHYLFNGIVGSRPTAIGPGAIRKSNVSHSMRKKLKWWMTQLLPYLRSQTTQQPSVDIAERMPIGKSHIFSLGKIIETGDDNREGSLALGTQCDNTVCSLFIPKHSVSCSPRTLVITTAR